MTLPAAFNPSKLSVSVCTQSIKLTDWLEMDEISPKRKDRTKRKKKNKLNVRSYIVILHCNREKGQENPLWNDCSSKHQHHPRGAREQKQEHNNK